MAFKIRVHDCEVVCDTLDEVCLLIDRMVPPKASTAAKVLGRAGRARGGLARAAILSPERRSEIARKKEGRSHTLGAHRLTAAYWCNGRVGSNTGG